jgi:hypothetical protein
MVAASALLATGATNAARHSDGNHTVGWAMAAVAVFFCGCTLFHGSLLVRRSGMELGPEGLRLFEDGRLYHMAWDDLGGFAVQRHGRDAVITFDLYSRSPQSPCLQALLEEPAGGAGCLGRGFAMSPEQLAELLNEASRRWRGMCVGQPD